MQKIFELLKRFRRDDRGAFLALFGVMAVVLIATAGATVDFTSVQNARTRAQTALDAAALALQPDVYKSLYTEEQVRQKAEALLIDRLGDASTVEGAETIWARVTSAKFTNDKTTVTLTATLRVPLFFVSLVGVDHMTVTVVSQTTRGSQDLEVAVALDVTGSMGDKNKIGALRTAASDMVDILVLDQQEPTYTKMALVPYSMGVNVGTYANSVRGPIQPAKTITAAAWMSGSSLNISAINKANPARVTTSSNHGLQTGDVVYVSGVGGMSQLRAGYYTVTRDNNTRFFLQGVDSRNYSNFSSGGTVRKCLVARCEVVVTSNGHGFANDQMIYITGVNGMTQLNGNVYAVNSVDANTFRLTGTLGPNYSTYTSGGQAYCTTTGCEYYLFQNAASNSWRLHRVSTCVTERVIAPHKYTDAAPATAWVGINYPSPSNPCLSNQIVPLTSDKATLKSTITNLKAEGSTAGQTGLAWAWYMLAPNFASLWPSDSRPGAYNQGNLIKVLVLMTDGSFNSVYCNGVISKSSTTGSGSTADQINCNATNGDAFTQAYALCDGMKANTGIIVYTVGFDIANQSTEKALMNYCASDPSKAYLAANATELKNAFAAIAQDIAQLRLSH
jgi:Flp pilus assembly protein TadG